MAERQGSCLCKKVTVTAKECSDKVGACHCNMCRKQNAGPFFAVDCGTSVEFSGEDQIVTYSSSAWAERGFCKTCGSTLFYRLKGTGQTMMSPELFEGAEFEFDHEVFIDEKPAHYAFSNKTKQMTGPEVFAMFSGS